MRASAAIVAAALLASGTLASADVIVTEGSHFTADVHPADGRVVFDLLDKIWLLPARGGEARALTDGLHPARQPRWSPDGRRILYQLRRSDDATLWLLDVASGTQTRIGDTRYRNRDADWHPDGERIVFSSARHDTGFDLWEVDLPTGLTWRISSEPGDETAPAWSRSGRHLAYIRHREGRYSLMLRRRGEPDTKLIVSDQPLSSPGWRPDGSLLTVLRHDGAQTSLDIVILSSPPLVRPFITNETLYNSPVRWKNRQQMLYTADGQIKTRGFADRRGRPLHFSILLAEPDTRPATVIAQRQLTVADPPSGRLVIRGGRLFDGIWAGYRNNMDVLIENGRIAAIEPRRDWPDATVLDPGNVTILPGYIDAWSALPGDRLPQAGAALLAYGITTLVTSEAVEPVPAWESDATPGPRILFARAVESGIDTGSLPPYATIAADATVDEGLLDAVAAWQAAGVAVLALNPGTGVATGADLLPGGDVLAGGDSAGRSPGLPPARRNGPAILVSGLADAATPGLADLLDSRQALDLGQRRLPRRRFLTHPQLAGGSGSFLLGSKANGMPPGLGFHAEWRALVAASVPAERILQAAGHGAAAILGLENQIGRITPGAAADLVLVSGDPLQRPEDALSIVAVVRNGRFYSLVSLLERAVAVNTVE